MNNILTAVEFLDGNGCKRTGKEHVTWKNVNPEDLIEFAQLHVKAALLAAFQNSHVYNKAKFPGDINYQVEPDSILEAYPLERIK